jgi:hypothetical protein
MSSPACANLPSDEWSLAAGGDWSAVVAAELIELGRSAEHVPEDADEAAGLLASARASLIRLPGERCAVDSSIVRASSWPGPTALIEPLASRAVDLALERRQEVDPDTDNDELVESVQSRLMPDEGILIGWVRDLSVGTLRDPDGSSRTGVEVLHTAADWLTWSLARAAMEVVRAMRETPKNE